MSEQQKCSACGQTHPPITPLGEASISTTPPRHSDEHLDDILYEGLEDVLDPARIADIASDVWAWHEAELKKREAAARLKGYEAGVGAEIPTEKLKAVDTIAQLHKEQPHEG